MHSQLARLLTSGGLQGVWCGGQVLLLPMTLSCLI